MLKGLLPAVVAAVILLSGAAGGPQKKARPKPTPPTPEEVKVIAPPKVTEIDLAAPPKVTEIDEVALKSLLGAGAGRARPLLVNFWATWCGPCREEFPDLVKIRAQYDAARLDFVLVSLDDPSDIDKAVPEFLSEQRATSLTSYLLNAKDSDAAINLVDSEWGGELPATFLYDRAGHIVFKHKGRVREAQLRAALDEALKAKPQEAGALK
ncbi:MAG: TlpA family protein disulfide reductase [Pyrinomonadaceae bacterium]